jgi:superfamily II DNA/RNA helicase
LQKRFIQAIRKDIELLRQIKNNWFGDKPLSFNFDFDPKIEEFKKELSRQLKNQPKRKIAVFTSYADTARYVYQKLKNDFRIFKYCSQDASEKNKKIIRANFDAGLPKSEQADDYDVLIATDAISEGYNLHRAGTVINFDIPYNPTRIIQRVGRINRINKKVFNELYIYNYFPSLIGEQEIRIRQVATLKIAMINALLGSDMKVLTEDEDIESYYQDEYKKAGFGQETESWDTVYRQELETANSKILEKARKIEKRTRIKRTKKKNKPGVLVFAKKGNDYLFKLGEENGPHLLSAEQALALFQASISEKADKFSNMAEEIYQQMRGKLFKQTVETKLDRADRQTIEKISFLIGKHPKQNEYLKDLLYVAQDLESLTKEDAKYIRNIVIKNKKDQQIIADLKKQIPPYYLETIIKQAEQIEDGEESLILIEELV